MTTSRIPGFYKMSLEDRKKLIAKIHSLTTDEQKQLFSQNPLPLDTAEHMIENVIGTYALPLGLGLNFLINQKEYMIPMVIEEPSVVASASHIAKIVREAGGFITKASERLMTGQIQVVGCTDFKQAKKTILDKKDSLIKQINDAYPSIVARGGGAKDLEVRIINEEENSSFSQMLIIHVYINTCDAMGANIINTMMESIALTIEEMTNGKVYLRILSNYTDRCLAKATCMIPPHLLATERFSGEEVRDGIILAYEFAASDPYRAVTHNKGIMNGIDAVVLATGNDWRAVEAGVHAHASYDGEYRSLSTWSVDQEGNLVGELELPMAVGSVGGAINVHPISKLALKILDIQTADELAQVIVSVGLAQNLGALKALATDGIQKGHMALHSRSVAISAGAKGELIDIIAEKLIESEDIRVGNAKKLLKDYEK